MNTTMNTTEILTTEAFKITEQFAIFLMQFDLGYPIHTKVGKFEVIKSFYTDDLLKFAAKFNPIQDV